MDWEDDYDEGEWEWDLVEWDENDMLVPVENWPLYLTWL